MDVNTWYCIRCIYIMCTVVQPIRLVYCVLFCNRFLMSSPFLEEVNLAGNLIGDGGGREVMLGLQMRKEMGLPDVRMTVSSSISPEIFSSIMELSKSLGAKKKGKKKGKKVTTIIIGNVMTLSYDIENL